MRALEVAREVDAPGWLVGAGAIRDVVWDRLHGAEPGPPKDVDVVYFDRSGDGAVEDALRARCPELAWDAKNQAFVHEWYAARFGFDVEPLPSSAEAVATFPETATAVGVRLERDGRLTVVAPCGLDDLLGLVHRRNPRRVSRAEFERRLEVKGVAGRWPRVRIERAPRGRFGVVLFDLDGTLLRGTSVSVVLAAALGRAGELDALEQAYRDGRVTNAAIADASAPWFTGRRVDQVVRALDDGPWIDGIAETVAALADAGTHVALATITWRSAAEAVARGFGLHSWCGTEMEVVDGVLTGTVARICHADDKAAFAASLAERYGGPAAAVGDSRSDLAMFGVVDRAIALNADAQARAAATQAVDTDDLRALLPLLV
jgi:HAD superfamily phosphoserine phosphatase-like hydrolase